jgi:hypothetical protein
VSESADADELLLASASSPNEGPSMPPPAETKAKAPSKKKVGFRYDKIFV